MKRIDRDKDTVRQMIMIYCRSNHHSGNRLCDKCAMLLEYAWSRLDHCPHGNLKPSCRKCTIHCYAQTHKEEIKSVMRFAGPRMPFIHPIAAIRHLIDEWT